MISPFMEIIGQVSSGHMIDEMSELQSLAMLIFMHTPTCYRPAHCMAGLAGSDHCAYNLADSSPLFMRAPPLCSEGCSEGYSERHNQVRRESPARCPQSQFLALKKSPCKKKSSGGL